MEKQMKKKLYKITFQVKDGYSKGFVAYVEGSSATEVKQNFKNTFAEQFDFAETNGYKIKLVAKLVQVEVTYKFKEM